MSNKKRDIEILVGKIRETQKKIDTFKENGISEKKIERLELLKLQYEDQLVNLELE